MKYLGSEKKRMTALLISGMSVGRRWIRSIFDNAKRLGMPNGLIQTRFIIMAMQQAIILYWFGDHETYFWSQDLERCPWLDLARF